MDERGQAQAVALVARLKDIPVAAVVSSPLQRCEETLAPLLSDRSLEALAEPDVSEVDYGAWTGKALKDLYSEPLWSVVQQHPSAAVFPEGEGLAQVQARAVAAVRAHDARIAEEHGPGSVWVLCSHGDVIKAVLADALGVHLDSFQRIVVDPCSVSVVQYTPTRPFVLRVNDNGGDLAGVVPTAPPEQEPSSDATVGGATGT